MDFSFVELRDNGAKRRENSSSDKFSKLYSRSKSPLIKGLEKNPPLLYSKSKEIRNSNDNSILLVKKFLEIESVLG